LNIAQIPRPPNKGFSSTDETTRLETARAILKVGADDYETVINYWAVDGVYKETVLTNNNRQEMWDYLDVIFQWSSGMELDILEELYETHPDGSMTYMATNEWYGTATTGYYVQPGMSIVTFRPGEGCANYQRDYFTEGDTWWGVEPLQPFVRQFRQQYIDMFGLSGRCFDYDGDLYSKYETTGCIKCGLDCNDYDPDINPGAEEIPGDGIDNYCDGFIDGVAPPPCFIGSAVF